MFYEVIPLKVFNSKLSSGFLTYHSATPLPLGAIVLIPLGKSTSLGLVFQKSLAPPKTFTAKTILKVLYPTPLPAHLLPAITWLSRYYLTPLPKVASLFLPSGLTKTRRPKSSPSSEKTLNLTPPPLNSAQKQALKELKAITSHTKLLHGITGSGKTNLYLSLALETFNRGESTILLVPEISLTSQLVQIFNLTFGGHVLLLHSKQTESERHLLWEHILSQTRPLILIGPRSALLSPLSNLGLIIIDEAHEPSYYQENAPKYSTLRLASFLAKTLKITCLQGTATPLITDYHLAKTNHACVSLTTKAKTTAVPPKIHLIDFKDRQLFQKNRYFSTPLLEKIKSNLANSHQTLIFHNRRGSAPLTLCENCGLELLCPTCFLPLTLHSDAFSLLCHVCGYHTKVPTNCPSCGHPGLIHKGFGTKLLEKELKNLFPEAKIARFDADNTKTNNLASLYSAVKSGEINLLIGTQTLAKGLDLPHLTTVGVVQADSSLHLPDFASTERTFHLLTQVIGRVGRGHNSDAHVFIQTYQPEHPAIKFAITGDYPSFYQALLTNRQKGQLPPFTYLAKLSLTYKTERIAIDKIKKIHQTLKSDNLLTLSPPTPAFHERTSSGYTWQIIIKSTSRTHLLKSLSPLLTNSRLHLSLDPPSLL